MGKKNRIICVLLLLTMIIGLLPLHAFADEDLSYGNDDNVANIGRHSSPEIVKKLDTVDYIKFTREQRTTLPFKTNTLTDSQLVYITPLVDSQGNLLKFKDIININTSRGFKGDGVDIYSAVDSGDGNDRVLYSAGFGLESKSNDKNSFKVYLGLPNSKDRMEIMDLSTKSDYSDAVYDFILRKYLYFAINEYSLNSEGDHDGKSLLGGISGENYSNIEDLYLCIDSMGNITTNLKEVIIPYYINYNFVKDRKISPHEVILSKYYNPISLSGEEPKPSSDYSFYFSNSDGNLIFNPVNHLRKRAENSNYVHSKAILKNTNIRDLYAGSAFNEVEGYEVYVAFDNDKYESKYEEQIIEATVGLLDIDKIDRLVRIFNNLPLEYMQYLEETDQQSKSTIEFVTNEPSSFGDEKAFPKQFDQQEFDQKSLLQKIAYLLSFGFMDIIRLTYGQLLNEIYNSMFLASTSRSIFYSPDLTEIALFGNIVDLSISVLLALTIFLMILLLVNFVRGKIGLRKYLSQCCILLLASLVPFIITPVLINFAFNKPVNYFLQDLIVQASVMERERFLERKTHVDSEFINNEEAERESNIYLRSKNPIGDDELINLNDFIDLNKFNYSTSYGIFYKYANEFVFPDNQADMRRKYSMFGDGLFENNFIVFSVSIERGSSDNINSTYYDSFYEGFGRYLEDNNFTGFYKRLDDGRHVVFLDKSNFNSLINKFKEEFDRENLVSTRVRFSEEVEDTFGFSEVIYSNLTDLGGRLRFLGSDKYLSMTLQEFQQDERIKDLVIELNNKAKIRLINNLSGLYRVIHDDTLIEYIALINMFVLNNEFGKLPNMIEAKYLEADYMFKSLLATKDDILTNRANNLPTYIGLKVGFIAQLIFTVLLVLLVIYSLASIVAKLLLSYLLYGLVMFNYFLRKDYDNKTYVGYGFIVGVLVACHWGFVLLWRVLNYYINMPDNVFNIRLLDKRLEVMIILILFTACILAFVYYKLFKITTKNLSSLGGFVFSQQLGRMQQGLGRGMKEVGTALGFNTLAKKGDEVYVKGEFSKAEAELRKQMHEMYNSPLDISRDLLSGTARTKKEVELLQTINNLNKNKEVLAKGILEHGGLDEYKKFLNMENEDISKFINTVVNMGAPELGDLGAKVSENLKELSEESIIGESELSSEIGRSTVENGKMEFETKVKTSFNNSEEAQRIISGLKQFAGDRNFIMDYDEGTGILTVNTDRANTEGLLREYAENMVFSENSLVSPFKTLAKVYGKDFRLIEGEDGIVELLTDEKELYENILDSLGYNYEAMENGFRIMDSQMSLPALENRIQSETKIIDGFSVEDVIKVSSRSDLSNVVSQVSEKFRDYNGLTYDRESNRIFLEDDGSYNTDEVLEFINSMSGIDIESENVKALRSLSKGKLKSILPFVDDNIEIVGNINDNLIEISPVDKDNFNPVLLTEELNSKIENVIGASYLKSIVEDIDGETGDVIKKAVIRVNNGRFIDKLQDFNIVRDRDFVIDESGNVVLDLSRKPQYSNSDNLSKLIDAVNMSIADYEISTEGLKDLLSKDKSLVEGVDYVREAGRVLIKSQKAKSIIDSESHEIFVSKLNSNRKNVDEILSKFSARKVSYAEKFKAPIREVKYTVDFKNNDKLFISGLKNLIGILRNQFSAVVEAYNDTLEETGMVDDSFYSAINKTEEQFLNLLGLYEVLNKFDIQDKDVVMTNRGLRFLFSNAYYAEKFKEVMLSHLEGLELTFNVEGTQQPLFIKKMFSEGKVISGLDVDFNRGNLVGSYKVRYFVNPEGKVFAENLVTGEFEENYDLDFVNAKNVTGKIYNIKEGELSDKVIKEKQRIRKRDILNRKFNPIVLLNQIYDKEVSLIKDKSNVDINSLSLEAKTVLAKISRLSRENPNMVMEDFISLPLKDFVAKYRQGLDHMINEQVENMTIQDEVDIGHDMGGHVDSFDIYVEDDSDEDNDKSQNINLSDIDTDDVDLF